LPRFRDNNVFGGCLLFVTVTTNEVLGLMKRSLQARNEDKKNNNAYGRRPTQGQTLFVGKPESATR